MNEKITILYVDDEPVNLMLFNHMFCKEYNVITADSGKKGILVLNDTAGINIVVSDMKMPHMTGLQFIRSAVLSHPKIDYYILSGYDLNEEIEEALNQGIIKAYFQKPFKKEEIVKAIKKAKVQM